ncbi:MAG: phage tail tape measure protein [Gordonia sp. (in: high G+C Gram-positive bacteria)]|nr:MAG: phage tail tape measure protein [Gordonia sp. (in: high G+C Gram-positive bacteria)]
MAGLIIGRLTAQLGLDDTGFTRGVRTAGSSMQSLGTQAKGAEQAIATAMRSAVSTVDRYAAKVEQARANQAAAASRAEKAERSLKAAQDQGNAQKAADAELRLAQARARLTTATQTTQEAVAGLQAANAGAAETSDEATESITNMGDSSDTTAGKLAALAAGAVGLGATMGSILTIGMDFTSNLNVMQAVSGATAQQMDKVGATARALGSDINLPGTSAVDAAAAMTELAKGGFSVDQSMNAAKGTLQLAAAAQIDAADAATIQSQALQAFGLNASYATTAADILANTSNASSAEITDVADALAQAGTVAAGFGVSMADTSTMLGLFANAGITGSDAGTLLKTALQSLTDQGAPAQAAIKELGLTVYDANGQFVGMRSLWEQLAVASRNMTDEQYQAATATLFGSDAMRAAMVAAGGGVEAYDQMNAKINQSGTAAELSRLKMQGLPGAWERVKNSLESTGLTVYDFIQGPLTSLASSGANIIGVGEGIVGALGFIAAPVGVLANAFGSLPEPMQATVTMLIALKIASMAFGNQINSVRNYASNAGGVLRNMGRDITNMQRAATLTGGSMNRLSGTIAVLGRNNATIASMGAAYLRASGNAQSFARTAGFVSAAAVGMRGAIGGISGALGGPFGIAIMGAIGLLTLWSSRSNAAKQKQMEHKAAVDELSKSIDVNTGKLNQQGREAVTSKLEDSGVLKMIEANQKWGVSIDQYTDAATGQVKAIDSVNAALDKQVTSSLQASDYWETNAEDYKAAGVSLQELTAAMRGNADAKKAVETKLKDAGWENYSSAVGRAKNSLDENGQSAIKTGDALGNMKDNIDEAAASAMRSAQANGDVVKSLDGTTEVVGPLTAAMTEFGESTDGSASKVDKLAKALDGLQDDKMTQEEALQSWSDNLRAFSKALEEGGSATVGLNGAIDVTTEKGSALQDSAREQASAFNEMAAATYEASLAQGQSLPDAIDTTRRKLEQSRQAFIDQAVAGGMSIEVANNLADRLGMIPDQVVLGLDSTAIQSAIDQLATLGAKAVALPEGQVRVVDNTPETKAKLDELGIKTQTLPDGKVVITDTAPDTMKRLSDLGIQTTALPGGFVKIEDTTPANIERLNSLGVKTTTLPNGMVVVDVDDLAAQEKLRLLTQARRMQVSVDMVQGVNSVRSAVGDIGFGRYGAIQTFAQGGHYIDKPTRADIYQPAADYTIFAEKKTKGETYLPWDEATRGRSLRIMDETAHAWGYQVVPLGLRAFADGGIATVGALKNYMRGIEGAQYGYGAWGQGWTTDCSGGQSIAMNYADGLNDQPGTGARAGTATFDSYTAGHGLQPGTAPAGVPAYEVTWNPEHTAGTIFDPAGGDVNIEMGGARGDGQYDGPDGSRSLSGSTAWMPLQGDPGAAGQIGAPDTRTAKQKNIDTVIAEGRRRGESDKEIKSAVMAVLAETGGENLDHGMDGDNAGILQQRPSWGTVEQRMDPAYAANAYYDAANKVEGAEGMTEAQLAQAVQRSGTADGSNYAAKEAEADAEIAASMTRSTTTQTGTATTGSGEPVFVTNWPAQLTTTTTSSTTSTPATSGATEESTTGTEKLGNIGPLAITAYARGAIEDRAPGSAQVLNRERIWLTQAGEAGPESYIPLDGSPRSKALWLETGRHLGMMDSYAAGGFAGYSEDTSDALKPRNFYDWAALVAGGGFAVASAVTPYVNMANSGQVTLGDMAPTVDTSANSIDGISQALGASADELKEVLIAILQATRENKKVKATIDSGVMDGLTPALSVAGL